jgi:arginyl-tRNA synthetase
VGDIHEHGEKFGSLQDGKGKQLVFEHAQPNTHKEVHVGHLRLLLLGASLLKILRFQDWKVVSASYHGDVGAHVAKCLWMLVREQKGEIPLKMTVKEADAILGSVPKEQRNGRYLGSVYTASTHELEAHPERKEEVSVVQRALEAHASGWEKIWQETRRWSVLELSRIFQELGVTIDRQYFESEVVEAGQKIVDDLLQQGVAKMSQGAVVVDLEEQKLGVFLIRKSDGTSLYATKDLELAFLKQREYPKAVESIILVDSRQGLYFKQLFATLKLMGYALPLRHVGFEFVTLKTGAMSSREGNIVTYESFRDELLDFARRETHMRHADWPQGRIEHTAWCLAMGGLKYTMLKQDNDKMVVFDMERALSFDGDTGPYIQYAATRLSSILKKAEWNPKKQKADLSLLTEPTEKQLALHLAKYPAACRAAAQELRPAIIAQWCLEMAHRVSDFYHEVNVLESEFGVKQARLALVDASRQVLAQALDLLGIPLPDEM